MARARIPRMALLLVVLFVAAFPAPPSTATHTNGDFDACNFSGWTMWQAPSSVTSAPSGSDGPRTWTREVGPAYAHDGACGLRMRCTAQLPHLYNYCHAGVVRTMTPATKLSMWLKAPEPTADGYSYDLYMRIKDTSGASVIYTFDPSWPSAYCNTSGAPTTAGIKCIKLPLNAWTQICLDIPGDFAALHRRAIASSYEFLILPDAHKAPAEIWVDTIRHGCEGDGGGDCQEDGSTCAPPDPPCRAQNLSASKGPYAFVGGGYANVASGSFSTVAGGYGNHASGLLSAIPGGGCNRAIGRASNVGGGEHNSAVGSHSTVGGGNANSVMGANATVGGGNLNMVMGPNATVGGGSGNQAWTPFSTVPGGKEARTRSYGQLAQASGQFTSVGDAQRSEYVLRGVSSGVRESALHLDGLSQQIQVPSGASFAFEGLVVARSPAGDSAGWRIEGVVENVGGVTSVLGMTVAGTSIAADPLALTWSVRAQGAPGVLQILATGAAGVRWVATIETSEVLVP